MTNIWRIVIIFGLPCMTKIVENMLSSLSSNNHRRFTGPKTDSNLTVVRRDCLPFFYRVGFDLQPKHDPKPVNLDQDNGQIKKAIQRMKDVIVAH